MSGHCKTVSTIEVALSSIKYSLFVSKKVLTIKEKSATNDWGIGVIMILDLLGSTSK
jgi:hypothetical protein